MCANSFTCGIRPARQTVVCRGGDSKVDNVARMNTRAASTPLAIPVWRLRAAAAQTAELDPHVTADEVLAELAGVP